MSHCMFVETTFSSPARLDFQPPVAGLPSISVPAGFNDKGLPMRMQLIGKPRELALSSRIYYAKRY